MKYLISVLLVCSVFIILQCTLKDNPVVVMKNGVILVKTIDASDSTMVDAHLRLVPEEGHIKIDSLGNI